MKLYENEIWNADIDLCLEQLGDLDTLKGKKILVTGATGLICSAVIFIIARYNDNLMASGGDVSDKIQVLAACRNKEKLDNMFGRYTESGDVVFVPYDATKKPEFDFGAEYIIHGASNAHPSKIMSEPVETMMSNFMGLKWLFDYAAEKGTKRILYISSSEVYGQKTSPEPFKEEEYGFIDLLNPRNSYPVGKRAAETLAASYFAEHEVEAVIVRPGHIYGPTSSIDDSRISSDFAYKAARGEDLVMKSAGSQIRSYCYVLDCASAMLRIMLTGENITAYNISNPNSIISIRQMAELYAEAGGVQLLSGEATAAEKKSYNTMDNSSLNSARLEGLGWTGQFDARTGLTHTVNIIKSSFTE